MKNMMECWFVALNSGIRFLIEDDIISACHRRGYLISEAFNIKGSYIENQVCHS